MIRQARAAGVKEVAFVGPSFCEDPDEAWDRVPRISDRTDVNAILDAFENSAGVAKDEYFLEVRALDHLQMFAEDGTRLEGIPLRAEFIDPFFGPAVRAVIDRYKKRDYE